MNQALTLTNAPALAGRALVPAAAWPSPTDFEAYARMANQCPVLEENQERALVERWQAHGDRDAARDLVLSHLRLVIRVVRDHRGYGLSPGDLAQEGTIGLMKAVQRFDLAVGVRLAAYALRWIEAEIKEFIFRNWRMVRLGTSAAMKKLFFGYRQALASLRAWQVDRPVGVSDQQLAQALELPVAQVREAAGFFGGRDLALAPPAGEAGDDSTSQVLALEMADPQALPEEVCEQRDTQAHIVHQVRAALSALSPREQEVIRVRRMQQPAEGLAEIAARWGVSAERVRQVEVKALKRLEQALRTPDVQDLLA